MITVRNIEELRAHIASMKKNVCGKNRQLDSSQRWDSCMKDMQA